MTMIITISLSIISSYDYLIPSEMLACCSSHPSVTVHCIYYSHCCCAYSHDCSPFTICVWPLPSVSQATDRPMGINGVDVAGLRPFDLVIPFTIQKGEITGILIRAALQRANMAWAPVCSHLWASLCVPVLRWRWGPDAIRQGGQAWHHWQQGRHCYCQVCTHRGRPAWNGHQIRWHSHPW